MRAQAHIPTGIIGFSGGRALASEKTAPPRRDVGQRWRNLVQLQAEQPGPTKAITDPFWQKRVHFLGHDDSSQRPVAIQFTHYSILCCARRHIGTGCRPRVDRGLKSTAALKEVASLGRPCHNQSTDGKPQAPMTTVPPADIFATTYHGSGIDLAMAITDRLGRPISSADGIKPIREVVG
jgi:hypothetical protein